jgi:hypothetical protein
MNLSYGIEANLLISPKTTKEHEIGNKIVNINLTSKIIILKSKRISCNSMENFKFSEEKTV